MADQPLPNYDKLNATQVIERIRASEYDDVRAILSYEQGSEDSRTTIVEAAEKRIRQLDDEAAQEAAESNQPTFTVERLLAEGNVILADVQVGGRPVSLGDVAGAFSGTDPSTEITLGAAKQRVRSWGESEVVIEPTPQDAATL